MPIIGSLPYTLANGTTGDATQVTSDLNTIVSGVNANASPIGTLTAPSGTRMVFNNASAPNGWSVDATVTNHGLRATNSAGGITSGQTNFATFLTGGWSAAAHALTAAEFPPHTHTFTPPYNTPAGSGSIRLEQLFLQGPGATFATDSGTGGGAAHSHTQSTQWNYIACVAAQKS
jgi:hypothetical protein